MLRHGQMCVASWATLIREAEQFLGKCPLQEEAGEAANVVNEGAKRTSSSQLNRNFPMV